jgi:transposase-like protein
MIKKNGHQLSDETQRNEFLDFAAMDERLGLSDPSTQDQPVLDRAAIEGDGLGVILEWVTQPRSLKSVGGRVVALAACLRPGQFSGDTITDVARQYGVTKQTLNKYYSKVRARFSLTSAHHQSDEAVAAHRQSLVNKARAGGDDNEAEDIQTDCRENIVSEIPDIVLAE